MNTKYIEESKNLHEFSAAFKKENINFNDLLINIRNDKTKMKKIYTNFLLLSKKKILILMIY